MSYFFQIWALPGLNLSEPLSLGPDITLKSVTVQPPGKTPFMSTLIQLEAQRGSDSESPEPQFRRLGQVLSRLSFALLCPFSVFSARVVSSGAKKGDHLSAIVFPGVPPGIALFESKVGFRKQLGLSPSFLTEDVGPQIEAAIGWFLAGNSAPNSVQQVLCHWIGLESLAPVIEGPWRCPECERELQQCPTCAEPTVGPKTVQTVRGFLRNDLGVSQPEYKSLYKLRCQVAHGALPHDPEGLGAASKQAARIQELLLIAIKRALGWDAKAPPLIDQQGMTVVGVPGLGLTFDVPTDDFYDQPGIYPA